MNVRYIHKNAIMFHFLFFVDPSDFSSYQVKVELETTGLKDIIQRVLSLLIQF